MKAVIVREFGQTPDYGEFREPSAEPGLAVVKVRAAPLSPIVKALARGAHYTSAAQAGFVPGVDGVGVDPEGRRVYFLFPQAPFGSMGELSLVAEGMTAPVPDTLSDVDAAAVATAGLASWIALTRKARLMEGQTVLINGATGAAGGMAAQIARRFGAGKVVAVGRNPERLGRVDADVHVALDDDADGRLRGQFDDGVDVVLDFLWGDPARRMINAAAQRRASRTGEPRLRYVQLGSIAGDEISLRADSLRGSGLELLGSGIGSVSVHDFIAGAGELLAEAARMSFSAPARLLPLSQAARAWEGPEGVRYLLTPD
ncbi:hypothetical protein P7B02_13580 [Caulobacter segnis]|uniref:zinc-binding dehydrogenase n=1 Tax=Caulobacter segnis TaxID=88688 RepID=UPI002410A1ED|nr:zinc-binding dehydrogenase [Caulobacter segnis]MDG2522575.1 hypothetical protein [Caulobacter segnis]